MNMNKLIERLGSPNLYWPKHEGHLKHKERIALVAFLACNGLSLHEILELRDTLDIVLANNKAIKAWNDLAKKFTSNEKYRRDYWAYSLLRCARVPIAEGMRKPTGVATPPQRPAPFDFIMPKPMHLATEEELAQEL